MVRPVEKSFSEITIAFDRLLSRVPEMHGKVYEDFTMKNVYSDLTKLDMRRRSLT